MRNKWGVKTIRNLFSPILGKAKDGFNGGVCRGHGPPHLQKRKKIILGKK